MQLPMDPTGAMFFPWKLHPARRFGYVHAKKKTIGQKLKEMHVNLFNMDMLMLKVRLFQHLPA